MMGSSPKNGCKAGGTAAGTFVDAAITSAAGIALFSPFAFDMTGRVLGSGSASSPSTVQYVVHGALLFGVTWAVQATRAAIDRKDIENNCINDPAKA